MCAPGVSGCLCPLFPAPNPSALCTVDSGPRLTGWQCPLCTVDGDPVCPCLTGCLCPLYVVDRQPDRKEAHTVGHWGTVIQRAHTTSRSGEHSGAHNGALSTVHTGGIDSKSDRGHTVGDTGPCLLYIQRVQTTSQSEGTQWGILRQSTVHTEGTYNQPDRGQTVGHTGVVNCTYKGHRQPVGHGHNGAVNCTYRGPDNQSDRRVHSGAHWGSQLYIRRAQTTSQTGDT